MKQGTLVVISAPSGGGKTTVIHKLLERLPNAGKVITSTTREIREQEENGVDYYFLTKDEFEQKIADGAFIEHAVYAGHHYGVEHDVLENTLTAHDFAFITPDIQGKKAYDAADIDHVAIFLVPESLEMLKRNIAKRGGMDEAMLETRMEVAKAEIAEAGIYDHKIVNRDGQLEEVIEEIIGILKK